MFTLAGTLAGEALEARFAGLKDQRAQQDLRSRLLGAAEVRHTLVLRNPRAGGSDPVETVSLHAGAGLQGDAHNGGLAPIDMVAEPVLARIYGMAGSKVLNSRQVRLMELAESTEVAGRLGIGYLPIGTQAENIVLDQFAAPGLGINSISGLFTGMMITFITPNGKFRTASLYVVGRALPHDGADEVLRAAFPQRLATSYQIAARGRCGIDAMVKTSGTVNPGDIALIWMRA